MGVGSTGVTNWDSPGVLIRVGSISGHGQAGAALKAWGNPGALRVRLSSCRPACLSGVTCAQPMGAEGAHGFRLSGAGMHARGQSRGGLALGNLPRGEQRLEGILGPATPVGLSCGQ